LSRARLVRRLPKDDVLRGGAADLRDLCFASLERFLVRMDAIRAEHEVVRVPDRLDLAA